MPVPSGLRHRSDTVSPVRTAVPDGAPSDGTAESPFASGILAPSYAPMLTAKLRWAYVGYLRSHGAFAAAAAWLDRIAETSGATQQIEEERANLLLAAERTEDALVILRAQAKRSPSATAKVRLARALLSADHLDEAAAIAHELTATNPDLATVQELAVAIAIATGDLETARAYHERTLAMRPGHPASLLALAKIALDQGNHRHAEECFAAVRDAFERGESVPLATAAEVALALGHDADAATLRAASDRAREEARRRREEALLAEIAGRLGVPLPDELPTPPKSPLPPEWPSRSVAHSGGKMETAQKPSANHDHPSASEPDPSVPPEVLEILHEAFGYESLRDGQARVIGNVLKGIDTLAIMPTGAGKSLTFQIPAMLLPGVTLVLSPLIALMKDQVESLPPMIRERTAFINSSLPPEEQRRVLDELRDGRIKLIYAAPERLRQWSFVRALAEANTSLVVIDEAHCISMWGHDFRPDYLQIPQALPTLGQPPILAITATATERMADEIGRALQRRLTVTRISVFRQNLRYEAMECANREEKVRRAVEVCRAEKGAGIVYVGSRQDAEGIATTLRQHGVQALPYHAGLDAETRARHQEQFMSGRVRVVVATVAFGMGVNKADVRFIVHLAPPRSLEAYAQESGRAGRDGKPARCVLLYTSYDASNLTRQSQRDQLSLPILRRVYVNLRNAAAGRWAILNPNELLPPGSRDTDGQEISPDTDPRIALGILEQAGLVRRHPDAPVSYAFSTGPDFVPRQGTGEWHEHVRWAYAGARPASGTLDTAAACDALNLTPTELAAQISDEPDIVVREGPRLVCIELLPVQGDLRARIGAVLERHHAEAVRRVAQMMAYAAGDRCRHQLLAAHLGQRMEPCSSACDVCDGTARRSRPERGGGKRVWTTASDALHVLDAVRTLPFPMGKTGLTRLLSGSVESSVRGNRSDSFGALRDVSPRRIGALIDQLVEEGFLRRDLNHEYKIVTLAPRGANAGLSDLIRAGHPPNEARSREH